jgi:hypothetical protein
MKPAALVLCLVAAGCEFSTESSTPPEARAQVPSKPKPTPVQRPQAKPAPRAENVVERGGLRFTYTTKLGRQDQGQSVDVSIRVESLDGKTHVIYGYGRGVAFGGIRFGKQGGGMPMGEGGTVQAFGRVRPGAPLVIGRSFPGNPAPGGGWTPLVPGDSLVLSVKTWHSVGEQRVSNPEPLEIGAVTVKVDDAGKGVAGVEQPKAR